MTGVLEGEAFLNYIWGLQPAGWRFVAWRNRKTGGWYELPLGMIRNKAKVGRIAGEWSGAGDLYFCPNSFSAAKRWKSLALPSRLMYQDLDESPPSECPLQPELWWETSPGRWQAIWVLDRFVEPQELQQLNRALNRACHADPGTWNLTRLLRVPGSWNAKRECRVSRAYGKNELLEAAA